MRRVTLAIALCGCASTPEEPTGDSDPSQVDTDVAVDTDLAPDTDLDPMTRAGLFVGVGDGGRWATSVDGLVWEDHIGSGTIDQGAVLSADAWRAVTAHRGFAVRVGGGVDAQDVGNATVEYSRDGLSWTSATLTGEGASSQPLRDVAAEGGTWIAIGRDGLIVRASGDPTDWTRVAGPSHFGGMKAGAVAGSRGTWIAVGEFAVIPPTVWATRSDDDGATWASFQTLDVPLTDLVASNGTWVGISPTACRTSHDGSTWVDCGLLEAGYRALFVHGDEIYVAFGSGQAVSTDGERWTRLQAPADGVPDVIAVGDGRWVGLRYLERGASADRVDWTWINRTSNPLRAISFLPTSP
jgi:hypothetical protein